MVSDWTEADLLDLYEQFAATREYEGNMSRAAAERAAYFDWRTWVGKDVNVPDTIREKVRLTTKERK